MATCLFTKFFSCIFKNKAQDIIANANDLRRGEMKMASSKKNVVPQAKAAMEKFKMEAANEVGVNLTNGYNGDLTSRQAGSIGGQMVKKMIEKYEHDLKSNG